MTRDGLLGAGKVVLVDTKSTGFHAQLRSSEGSN